MVTWQSSRIKEEPFGFQSLVLAERLLKHASRAGLLLCRGFGGSGWRVFEPFMFQFVAGYASRIGYVGLKERLFWSLTLCCSSTNPRGPRCRHSAVSITPRPKAEQ